MSSTSAFWLLALGFILGLKHSFDADHLAAVSTMAGERRSLFGSSLIGALWGLGHTIALMIAGVLVMLLNFQISERSSKALEFCVGLMLIGLGVNTLYKLVRGGRLHIHPHEHRGRWHVHPHLHAGKHTDGPHTHHGLKLSARPLLIGLVHGMAGSAALTLLVLTTVPSSLVGFIYIAIFGIGSIGGMMIMSTLFALPARLTSRRFTRADMVLRGLAGGFSFCLGMVIVYQIGFVDHLLR
jgi:ABC-type nickel/cobalt efflux system permease component RcnA